MKLTATLGLLALATLLAACQGMINFRQGQALLGEGQIEQSLEKFRAASLAEPGNAEYRSAYLVNRERAIAGWLAQADALRGNGEPAKAEALYRRILGIDAGNARALAALDDQAREARHNELLKQAKEAWAQKDGEGALARLHTILGESPRHRLAADLRRLIMEKSAKPAAETALAAALKRPISIEFRDTPIKQVFEVFARTSGLNFVFDREVRNDLKTSVFLRNTTVADAVNLVLLTSQLDQRVLDASSILIYPNTPAKAREYQPLTVRSFFLNNADVKSVGNTLRAIVKTRDLVVDEKQNMIVMRDTPEAVRLAEKLVALHDLPEPEVMLEVEILEVSRTRLVELGVQWPSQLTLTPLSKTVTTETIAPTVAGTTTPTPVTAPVTTTSAAPSSTNLTINDLRGLTRNSLGATVNPLVINANKQDSEANLLANPRIRSRNREKAKILVGDRVPNVTTTSTSTGFVSENVSYIDVGLKLEVEPTVYMDDEVAIKIGLEVSNIVSQVQTKSGTLAYQIGTRTANTALRLKDGENQVLAGLISNEDRNSGAKIPALGDLPILGRLFGSQRDDGRKTEIVLSITPRILRNPQRPPLTEAEFDSGTEASIKSRAMDGGGAVAIAASQPEPAPGGTPAAVVAPVPVPIPTPTTPTPVDPGAAAAVAAPITSPGAAAATASATSFSFAGPASVKLGSPFEVSLQLQAGQPINAIPFTIAYDPKALTVTSLVEGELLGQGGGASSFSSRIDNVAGRIFGSVARPANAAAIGQSGTLVTLKLQAVSAAAPTSLRLLQANPQGADPSSSFAAQLPPPWVITITP